jgi:predicted sugar kinase
VWERGRAAEATLAELTSRVAVPDNWRIVLVAPTAAQGLSGAAEQRAFAQLPVVADEVTRRLECLAETQILPAARMANVEAFGEAVYEYGRLSGESTTRDSPKHR